MRHRVRTEVPRPLSAVAGLPTERKVAVMGGEHGTDTDQRTLLSKSSSETSR
jgi:hypothetical protein